MDRTNIQVRDNFKDIRVNFLYRRPRISCIGNIGDCTTCHGQVRIDCAGDGFLLVVLMHLPVM
jgi:hypothetical protein